MDVMDLLYENEETSVLYRSAEALAASIVACLTFLQLLSGLLFIFLTGAFRPFQVVAYVITVPLQMWEFPVLPWGKNSIHYMKFIFYFFMCFYFSAGHEASFFFFFGSK